MSFANIYNIDMCVCIQNEYNPQILHVSDWTVNEIRQPCILTSANMSEPNSKHHLKKKFFFGDT